MAPLDMTHNTIEMVLFNPEEMLGILDEIYWVLQNKARCSTTASGQILQI